MPAVSSHLPALVDHRHLRFAALYAAQGLPFGLFAVAIPAWLAAQGASAAEIGSYLAIATLPPLCGSSESDGPKRSSVATVA